MEFCWWFVDTWHLSNPLVLKNIYLQIRASEHLYNGCHPEWKLLWHGDVWMSQEHLWSGATFESLWSILLMKTSPQLSFGHRCFWYLPWKGKKLSCWWNARQFLGKTPLRLWWGCELDCFWSLVWHVFLLSHSNHPTHPTDIS